MMDTKKTADDLSIWISTYGAITVAQILKSYEILLDAEELLTILKKPDNIYRRLLEIPRIHGVNGIILEQAREYQLYAQKTLIDYLLSMPSDLTEDSPSASIREDLEQERVKLVEKNDALHEIESTHEVLVVETQTELRAIVDAYENTGADIDDGLANYIAQANEIGRRLKESRTSFRDSIMRLIELLDLLPEYTRNEAQDNENLERLHFDQNIE